jgi:hypothetical protein
MHPSEEAIWEKSISEFGPDKPTEMEPVVLRVPFEIDSVTELMDAIGMNYDLGLIDDNQIEIAMGFCDNLLKTKRPSAEIAELPISEENGEFKIRLVLPKLKYPDQSK